MGDKLCTVTSDGEIKWVLSVWDYMVSGDMLYVKVKITDYNLDAKYQESCIIPCKINGIQKKI